MNLMRTNRLDNLREINRIDSIKRRKVNESAQQTVIHEELAQKPSRVEVHSIEPTTTTKSSLTHPDNLLENAQELYLPEALERSQEVTGTVVTLSESVRQAVTKAVGSEKNTLVKDVEKDVEKKEKAHYKEVVAVYQATKQPDEFGVRTSIFA